ncbi:response regulator, partial [Candidatus Woesearchaeota archaeon]|nr:response regulator [Candidatus Woesearchaeota archaeon]
MVKNDNLEKKIDNQIKVLIVDDEKSVLSSIISLCNKSNFDYKAYESGEDVIENFTDYDPDVIL